MHDLVFITHLPAFYKVRLYNEIAKRQKIFVIFIGSTSIIRNSDFVSHPCVFEHTFLHQGHFEERAKAKCLIKLISLLIGHKAKRIVVGGWELPEFWLSVLFNTKKLNALSLESSIYESNIAGPRAWIKKIFLSNISKVYASGQPHKALLKALGYQGEIAVTKGVGLFDRQTEAQTLDSSNEPEKKICNNGCKFLFVGRLSSEKNVELLVDVFLNLPQFSLSIVGSGPQEHLLKSKCEQQPNHQIQFLGSIPNQELCSIYQTHNIFILPSMFEPWGLVVEEALFNGLFVLTSDSVGCHRDLINPGVNGLVFEKNSKDALIDAIHRAVNILYERVKNTSLSPLLEAPLSIENKSMGFDFVNRDLHQINVYCN